MDKLLDFVEISLGMQLVRQLLQVIILSLALHLQIELCRQLVNL